MIEGAAAFDRRLDSPLVGRHGELERLRATFDEAVAGRSCRLVTVLGPPGIGKSRISRELEAALAADATVLTGSCLPYGDGITYWPLVEIFRDAGAEDELDAALTAGGPEEIFLSVRRAFEQRAREQPLALLIEDIHWAEPTLLDLLDHLVDWTRDAPLLLLCSARPELLDERPAWGGQEQAENIRLEPLSRAESDELIDELVDNPGLREEIRARIRDTAEGNPLFVEQLLAAVSERGETEELPPTIHALLAARLDGLRADERDVLERASVVGQEFEWEALAVLSADGSRPPGALLSTLVRKELIVPHEAIGDDFRFRHVLIRDAAYERIPKERRAELHERFADWLEPRGPEFEEIVGYHLEQAYRSVEVLGPIGERGRALAGRAAEHLAATGLRAERRGDARAAASLLERAAALLLSEDPRRLALLPTIGRTLREQGEQSRADVILTEAVELARTSGQRAVEADAALSLTELRFNRTSETGVTREEMVRETEAAIGVFEELGYKQGLARALCLKAKLSFWKGQTATALEEFERSARFAREAGDRTQEVESLRYVLTSLNRGPTPADEALARYDGMRELVSGDLRLRIGWFGGRGRVEAMRGNFDVARKLVAEATAVAEGLANPFARDGQVGPAEGDIELAAGDASRAIRAYRRAIEAYERAGELGYLASLVGPLVDALLANGELDEALEVSARWPADELTVPEDIDAQAGWRRARARVLARDGRLDEAEVLAREGVAMASETDFLPLHADTLAALAEVLRLAGRAEEAETTRAEAIRLYEQKGNVAAAAALSDRAGTAGTRPA